jgi:transposase
MTLEEIWIEAKSDLSNSFFIGDESLYTIQNGCKIERFNNGKIVIHNTRIGNDFYYKLTKQEELMPFYVGGWHYGTDVTTLNTYKKQVEDLNKTINKIITNGTDPTLKQRQRQELLKKIHEKEISNQQRYEHIISGRLEASDAG